MLDEVDRAYYSMRAQQSRLMAVVAADPFIAAIHRNFAETYEARLRAIAETRNLRPFPRLVGND